MGYTKNIAVIKGVKEGFSADGGALSGLIKCERYGARLFIEASLINFAPLTEGRYLCAVTDGENVLFVENCRYEGESPVNTGEGFGAAVFYVNGGVNLIATAVCGAFKGDIYALTRLAERAENIASPEPPEKAQKEEYSDEAIAEVNYYEYEPDFKGESAVHEGAQKKDKGRKAPKNAGGADSCETQFYKRVQSEVDGILKVYPEERALEELIENSKWVKIDYGEGKYYLFGVLYKEGVPQYFCYGVPAENKAAPPESLAPLATFLPKRENADEGYWIMYQNAATGESVKIKT